MNSDGEGEEEKNGSSSGRMGSGGRRKITLQVKQPERRQHRTSTLLRDRKAAASKKNAEGAEGAGENAAPKKRVLEDVINLEVLMQLKTAFMRADQDGGGDLSIEEFVRAFRGILGADLGEEGLRQMFMKIDANADGTVDWDEFSSFMLLQNQGKQSMLENETHAEYTEVADQGFNLEQARYEHRDMIDHILYLQAGDKWATTSRDGTIRFWHGKDLTHLRTLRCGKAWVTDIGYLARQNKLVASTFNRNIRVYDMSSLEVVGKLSELEHTVLSLDCWTHTKSESTTDRLATGDNGGNVQLYQVSERDDDEKAQAGDHWRMDRQWKVNLHSDWVSKVRYMPDVNALCSASLDRTLCLYDVERRGAPRRLLGHTKGVYSFDWSPSFKFIASCGLDRHVLLWNPFSAKLMGTLIGHSASIQEVLIIERENQILSIGVDKVLKVWDIRNHKCIQTFVDKDYYRPENRISAAQYDKVRRQLLTAATALKPWPLKNWDLSRSGQCHGDAVSCALYNENFHQVVSGDQSSNVCVWEVESGRMRFRFGGQHGAAKITTMAFDKAGRRLLTGTHDGVVKVWNFSNGSCLKELRPHAPGDEVTSIEYVHGGYQNKNVIAVGWNRKVTFWEDGDKKVQDAGRQLDKGHADDILCSAMSPPCTLATGSYDGMIVIWNIDSGAIKMKLQTPNVQTKLLTERAVEKVKFMQRLPGFIVTCHSDLMCRFWDTLQGMGLCLERHTGHTVGESVVVMTTDPQNRYLATGDSAGFVKVWDISLFSGKRLTIAPVEEQMAACRELRHWRAHTATLSSLEYITQGDLLVTASADCNVILWSIHGIRVGNFGRDSWLVENPATWVGKEIEPMEGVEGTEEERWTAEVLDDSSEEEEDDDPDQPEEGDGEGEDGKETPSNQDGEKKKGKKKGKDKEAQAEQEEEFVATPMEMLAYKRFEKHERKEAPLSQRIWLPHGNKTLNHPHTPGRPATSIAHLLHIHDLSAPGGRPDTSYSGHESAKDDHDRTKRRPTSVNASNKRF